MPAHNEADCIRPTLTEIHRESGARVPHEFLVCEDGSTDGTREILHAMTQELPRRLITSPIRQSRVRLVPHAAPEVGAHV